MGKKSGSRSGINILDHISESVVTIFGLKNRYFNFFVNSVFGNRCFFYSGSGIRDGKSRFGKSILISNTGIEGKGSYG
jgi:hypothetical protein